VTLTVTDDGGATGAVSHQVTVSSGAPPANSPPTAAFISSCTALTCTFDGTGSSDTDGTIASYAWTFGDTQNDTGSGPSHTYAGDGTYSVTLTVTDDGGATGAVSHQVTVSSGGGGGGGLVSFVAAAQATGGSARVEQVTVPASAEVGDTMVLVFTGAPTWTGPTGVTGWTSLGSFTIGTSRSAAWVKTVAPGDVGSTVRMDNTVYTKGVLDLVVYSGVAAGQVSAAHAGDVDASVHEGGVVSATAGAWIASIWSDKSSGTTAWTAPAGVRTRASAYGTGGGRYSSLVADTDGPVVAGSYGPLSASTDVTSINAAAWTIALPATG
jgi:PKD repeat protein